MSSGSRGRPRHRKTGAQRIRLSALKETQRETYRRVLDAIKYLRERRRPNLGEAAREAGTSIKSIKRYGSSAIHKQKRAYRARPSDRLRRELTFYDERGQITLVTHSSRQASEVAKYHNAVRSYIVYGDDTALKRFEGKNVTVHGKSHDFLTDRRTLNRLARAGELHFLDIYKDGGS